MRSGWLGVGIDLYVITVMCRGMCMCACVRVLCVCVCGRGGVKWLRPIQPVQTIHDPLTVARAGKTFCHGNQDRL